MILANPSTTLTSLVLTTSSTQTSTGQSTGTVTVPAPSTSTSGIQYGTKRCCINSYCLVRPSQAPDFQFSAFSGCPEDAGCNCIFRICGRESKRPKGRNDRVTGNHSSVDGWSWVSCQGSLDKDWRRFPGALQAEGSSFFFRTRL